jgi:hypothetical protein
MPGLPVIADTYRVAFNWVTASGAHAVNVMHFLKSGTTAAAVNTSIDALVTANMWAVQEGGTHVTRLDTIKLDGSSASASLTVTGAKWTGTAAAGDWVPQMAAIVKAQSLFRGRSHRGRIFLPFVAESQSTNGVLGGGAVAAGQTAWTNFLAAAIAAGLQPVVASYLLASQVPIATYTFESVAGTQRRRMTRLR